ncbi:MAG: DUF1349 domain-containing protein [Planctomycetota bacterium]|jgi:regulation of enolase protein 1 (concanavalin A-like superfamily)
MCKKLIFSVAVVMVLGLAGDATANNFTDAGPTHFFTDPNNWAQGVPNLEEGGQRWGDMTVDGAICIITAPMNVSAGGLYPGCYGADNMVVMTGGYLQTQYFNVGRGRADGNHEGSKGYFLMTGGVIETEGFKIPNQFDEQEFGPWTGTEGHVDLYGGEIYVSGWFHVGSRDPHVYEGGIGTMDITEGMLVVQEDPANPGAVRDKIQGYIDNGWITAYDKFGGGTLELDYDVRNPGMTTLTALPAPPTLTTLFSDDFETPQDYIADGVGATGWDGFLGLDPNETVDALNASIDSAGQLYLASTNGSYGAPWTPLGPFLYKIVEGDFIATVNVTDYAGTADDVVYHNNTGLMARAEPDDAGPGEDWVSIDYFPIWNCGNFVRSADDNVRTENGHNGLAWDSETWLQLERVGNTFHLRTSADGITFTEMSQSPLTRDDMDGIALQVGVFHATYSDNQGYAAFDDFSIEAPE